METGDIILIPFPFSDLSQVKLRPALVISTTKDKYKDLILAAISSKAPAYPDDFEMLVTPNTLNNLRATSVIKIDRIFTLKKENKITDLGRLSLPQVKDFKEKFKSLVE